ncbi:MAG: energy-coupling factor transporter ATPase [Clostridiales bacterium]|nr:energy-coupling factor transporter ATPase [Clostridiales bacterium]
MSVVLEAKNVTYRYGRGTPFEVAAVEDVSFAIERGELVGVIGHTGSGKSTLIQHFNGLLQPTSGMVLLDGEDVWADKAKLRSVRFRVGLCFQYPEYQLFESTVYADIAFGPKNMGLSEDEIDRRVRRAAQFVGLREDYFKKSPFDLSGGEKRRAAIAGVMAMEPEVLILDEPTAGLDPRGRDTILELVKNYQRETGSTVLLVSHSMEDVARLATKVLVMNHAHLAMYGSVPEVYSRGDELVKMGLNVPQVTRIFMELKKRGFPVSDSVYTVAQGREELLRLKRREGETEC